MSATGINKQEGGKEEAKQIIVTFRKCSSQYLTSRISSRLKAQVNKRITAITIHQFMNENADNNINVQ